MEKLPLHTHQILRAEWEALLEMEGLRPELPVDAAYGIFEGGSLVATGARYANILKMIAIHPDYRGGAMLHELMSGLINEVYYAGFREVMLYTKPSAASSFEPLGFRTVETVPGRMTLMERASEGLSSYLETLREETRTAGFAVPPERHASFGQFSGDEPAPNAFQALAIVMNANPFTRGHRYLIEQALARAAKAPLHLFVVTEDASLFPADVRRRLVAEGTADLPGIVLHETGPYLVSAATFPSYFLKSDDEAASIQATLDARLFKFHIAPALGIDARFVGEEPLSPTTQRYNDAMQDVFAAPPAPGQPKLIILPRRQAGEEPISASRVRALWQAGENETLASLVPPTTLHYLLSDEAQALRRRKE